MILIICKLDLMIILAMILVYNQLVCPSSATIFYFVKSWFERILGRISSKNKQLNFSFIDKFVVLLVIQEIKRLSLCNTYTLSDME
jgi:hypothetical protein